MHCPSVFLSPGTGGVDFKKGSGDVLGGSFIEKGSDQPLLDGTDPIEPSPSLVSNNLVCTVTVSDSKTKETANEPAELSSLPAADEPPALRTRFPQRKRRRRNIPFTINHYKKRARRSPSIAKFKNNIPDYILKNPVLQSQHEQEVKVSEDDAFYHTLSDNG